jgi:glycosyltransferase involved in cell wall biosynthesis
LTDLFRSAAEQARLAQRLSAVADILAAPASAGVVRKGAGSLLDLCVRATQENPSPDRVWLLCAGVFGAYPGADDVRAAVRYLQLNSPSSAAAWLLNRATVVEAAIANERWLTLREEARAQRASVPTATHASKARTRARAAAVQLTIRVPALKGVFQMGRRGFQSARARSSTVTLRIRRRLWPDAPSGAPPDGPEARDARRGEFRVVTDRVVIDVDHSARHDLHTGIQQVVRQTLPLWERDHPILAVAWTLDRAAWRTLTPSERHRAIHRGGDYQPRPDQPPYVAIPWRTVVVLPETPPHRAAGRLAALAEFSGNTVVAVGYDCIPVVSGDLVPASEAARFAHYLTVLKHSRRVAGVSRSATAEFAGFAAALPAQGLPGPNILECSLPGGPNHPVRAESAPLHPPLVICVGTLEPRKNHLALLYAAERLWRDGLTFQLLLVAASGWDNEVSAAIKHLQRAGRLITMRYSPPDLEVEAAYRAARFTVLVSLHEGYGLPVAESLAWGTPVITCNYGSTREIAAGGGAFLIDPRDDEALVAAMRRLLTDDDLHQSLQQEARGRAVRTWEQYAADLWDHLVGPELPNPMGQNQ